MMVARVWKRARLQPHRIERYMASNDSDFEKKAADIIGLYVNPPQHAAVFCVDDRGRPSRQWTGSSNQTVQSLDGRLFMDARCHRWSGPVLCLLQPGTQSSVPGVPDARSGLLRKYGLMGPKRTMLRIDRGGDRRLHAILARFFSAPVRSVVENATLVGIRKEHGFPQVFGKASQKTLGFPTFFTTPTARTITHQFEAVGIQLRLADFLSKEWGDPPGTPNPAL